jgi:hypothetical protein
VNPDTDTDPGTPLNPDPIPIRIRIQSRYGSGSTALTSGRQTWLEKADGEGEGGGGQAAGRLSHQRVVAQAQLHHILSQGVRHSLHATRLGGTSCRVKAELFL